MHTIHTATPATVIRRIADVTLTVRPSATGQVEQWIVESISRYSEHTDRASALTAYMDAVLLEAGYAAAIGDVPLHESLLSEIGAVLWDLHGRR